MYVKLIIILYIIGFQIYIDVNCMITAQEVASLNLAEVTVIEGFSRN